MRRGPSSAQSEGLRLSGVRAVLGLVHLLAPGLASRHLVSRPFGRGPRVAVRALGVRQLAQALVTVGAPNTAVLSLGVGADAAHGASMLTLALFSRRWRRAALVEALIATAFASIGAAVAVRTAPPAAQAMVSALSVRASRGLPSLNSSSGEPTDELGGRPLA
jgi:hypothetical protein